MIKSYYRCCCKNEPVHLQSPGHRFHALLNVCSDRDNTAPLRWIRTIQLHFHSFLFNINLSAQTFTVFDVFLDSNSKWVNMYSCTCRNSLPTLPILCIVRSLSIHVHVHTCMHEIILTMVQGKHTRCYYSNVNFTCGAKLITFFKLPQFKQPEVLLYLIIITELHLTVNVHVYTCSNHSFTKT